MPVNTAKVEDRRTVNYASLQEVLDDAERLGSGDVKAIGSWSAGQVFWHLARAFNGSIDGLPGTFPWYIRTMAGLFKKKLIAGAMPPGMKPPSDLAAAVIPEPTSTDEGLAELRPPLPGSSTNHIAPGTPCSASSPKKNGTRSTLTTPNST